MDPYCEDFSAVFSVSTAPFALQLAMSEEFSSASALSSDSNAELQTMAAEPEQPSADSKSVSKSGQSGQSDVLSKSALLALLSPALPEQYHDIGANLDCRIEYLTPSSELQRHCLVQLCKRVPLDGAGNTTSPSKSRYRLEVLYFSRAEAGQLIANLANNLNDGMQVIVQTFEQFQSAPDWTKVAHVSSVSIVTIAVKQNLLLCYNHITVSHPMFLFLFLFLLCFARLFCIHVSGPQSYRMRASMP
jgi:hypothetical protein